MKNNTNQAKNLLVQAIRAMPNDFALSEARIYLTRALDEIQRVESKRSRREGVAPTERFNTTAKVAESSVVREAAQAPQWTPEQVLNVVNYIDKMIDEEKKKITEIHAQRQKSQEPSSRTVDDIERLLRG